MDYVTARPRYFNGQFLVEKDFLDEQVHHGNKQMLHHRMLHTAGVIEGLDVSLTPGGASVVVTAGAAVDLNGNLILLAADAIVPSQGLASGSEYILTIAFSETPTDPAPPNYVPGNTRFTQTPAFAFVAVAPGAAPPAGVIVLGRAVSNGSVLTGPPAVGERVYSGVRLPGQAKTGFQARARWDQVTGGDLSIERFNANGSTAALVTVTAAGATGIGDPSPLQRLVVTGGNVGIGYNTAAQTAPLAVNGNVGIGTPAPLQRLTVSGGNVGIGYNTGAQTAALAVNGNVGIGTPSPLSPLEVAGQIHASAVGFKFPDGSVQTHAISDTAAVPVGGVIDWFRQGVGVPIPAGYKLCDGTVVNDPQSPLNNVTVPDLRGRFVIGANNTFPESSSGGASTHQHPFVVDVSVSGTTGSAGAHNHQWYQFTVTNPGGPTGTSATFDGAGNAVNIFGWGDGMDQGGTGAYGPLHAFATMGFFTNNVAAHVHSFAATQTFNGTTTAANGLPPYVGLLKIMRIK